MRAAHRALFVTISLMLAVEECATAGILDPNAFPSQGAFPTTPGGYTIEDFLIVGPGGISIPAVGFNTWDFDSINIRPDMNFFARGRLPVVLLSRGDIAVDGSLSGSAYVSGFMSTAGVGGPGGYAGGSQFSGTGGGPGGGSRGTGNSGGGGGGYGGAGGNGANGNSIGFPPPQGGAGGPAYAPGSGGSGGGAGSSIGGGGGGGGALELAALGRISVAGGIDANGGRAVESATGQGAGGGGSGGLIYLQAPSLSISGSVSAAGGSSFSDTGVPGGSGGGGWVELVTAPGGFEGSFSAISVAGANPGQVVLQQTLLPPDSPEPSSVLLLGVGLLGLLAAIARQPRMGQKRERIS